MLKPFKNLQHEACYLRPGPIPYHRHNDFLSKGNGIVIDWDILTCSVFPTLTTTTTTIVSWNFCRTVTSFGVDSKVTVTQLMWPISCRVWRHSSWCSPISWGWLDGHDHSSNVVACKTPNYHRSYFRRCSYSRWFYNCPESTWGLTLPIISTPT